MYKLSKRSIDRLDGVKAVLVAIITEGIKDSPYDFGIPKDGGLRTLERQKELFAIGRTVRVSEPKITWTLNSNHMAKEDGCGHAFDVFAYVDGRASWNHTHLEEIARHLQDIADEYGVTLDWGYDLWGKDAAHFQLRE